MSNPWEATELFGKMLGEYTDNGYRQGVYEERERIIALLEHERYYTNGDDQFETAHSVPCVTCKNIALIKGENK